MGDYTKIIITAELDGTKVTKEILEERLKEIPLCESAYHCEGSVIQIESGYENDLNFILIGQTKYARGQYEFLDWLEPFVTQGSGENNIWAYQIHEYGEVNFRQLDGEF